MQSSHHTIIRTDCISFPRSGHGALYHVLKRYFGDALHYCAPLPPNNCGCGRVPCTNPTTNFTKNHDFGLYQGGGVEIRPKRQYLIQFRNPVRSIISNYHLFLEQHPSKNSRKEWYFYAHQWLVFWNRLIDKWALDVEQQITTRMMLSYEHLVQHPANAIGQVITFMTGDEARLEHLQHAIAQVDLKPRNRYADFPYLDRGFIYKLEELAGPRLALLNLPSFADSI